MKVKLLSYSRENFTMPIDQDVTIGKDYCVVDAFVEYDNKIYHHIIDDVNHEHLVLITDCEQIDKRFTITTDCYCDVSGWTDEEVQQAAEIFKDAVEGSWIDDLEVFDEFHYLTFLNNLEVFVSSSLVVDFDSRKTQLTKEEVFNMLDKGDDEVIWDGVGKPPVGTVCECIAQNGGYLRCKVIDHGHDYVIVHFYPNKFNYKVDWARNGCRRIKTQAEKDIEELTNDMELWPRDSAKEIAERLYNLGYSKKNNMIPFINPVKVSEVHSYELIEKLNNTRSSVMGMSLKKNSSGSKYHVLQSISKMIEQLQNIE